MGRRMGLAAWLAVLGVGCPKQEEHYSSDLGVDGVTLTEGQLAGTWYGVLEFATVITLPVLGKRNAGANGGRLLRLSWDGSSYQWESTWCWDDVFEVEGTKNTFTDESLHALRPMRLPIQVDHQKGSFDSERYADVWGVQNMPDNFTTELPNKDTYQSPPQSDWILDEDHDGNPGVTVHMSGTFSGDGYILNRSIFRLHGVARSADEVVGLMPFEKVEQKLLDSNIVIPGTTQKAGDTDQEPDPNPRNTWFQLVRGREGATCQDVLDARASGKLATRRPF